jgi:glycerophosphoryl diester phosphodiesterase
VECAETRDKFLISDFSIGHRGAPLQFPEHTAVSYKAASRMGAGIIECDVTFTKDLELVCRHSQCDLHTTTDIVTRPELNAKCTTPWSTGVSPSCCTSDFSLEEIKTLCAKMDSSNDVNAVTAEGYAFGGTADFRTDNYQTECESVPTHKESIELILSLGGKFTPELKTPAVEMPFEGFSQTDFAQKMIDELIMYSVPPEDVWQQSALAEDVRYWVENTDYGDQAVALDFGDDRPRNEDIEWLVGIQSIGAKYVAPPMWKLVEANPNAGAPGQLDMVPSNMAIAAKSLGFEIVTWTLDRTNGPLAREGPAYYWQTLMGKGLGLTEGSRFELLHVLNVGVGIRGIFDDWPAVTTFYANCMNKLLRAN